MSKTTRKNGRALEHWPLARPSFVLPAEHEVAAMVEATRDREIAQHPGHVVVYCESADEYRALKQDEIKKTLIRARSSCRLVPSGVWFAHLLASRIQVMESAVGAPPTIHTVPEELVTQFKAQFGTFSENLLRSNQKPRDAIANLIATQGTELNVTVKSLFSQAACTDKARAWFKAEKEAVSKPRRLRVSRCGVVDASALSCDADVIKPSRATADSCPPAMPQTVVTAPILSQPAQVVAAVVSSGNDRMDFLNSVGAAARAARESAGLTVETLSNETGLGEIEIKAVEKGTVNDSARAGMVYAILRGFFRKQDSNIPQVAAFNAAINQHEQATAKSRI
jgi:hypothetical protein